MVGRKKTHGEFITEVKNLVSDEYIVLGDYRGSFVFLTLSMTA